MKKLLLFTYFIILNSLTYAQFISYEYTEILIYSVKINYSSSNGYYQPWSPDLNFYGNALAQMQARYDRNHSSLSKEYFKLKDLKLINTTNQSTLNNYRTQRLGWVYNTISSWDLGNETNTANIRNYCCEIYSYSFIKNEITLLQSCQTELNRIKYKDPDNYLYSKRYQSIMKTLDKLKNCSTSEISRLSWERTELENKETDNPSSIATSSNNTNVGATVRIGNLEVMTKDLEHLSWDDAMKACADLGDGWRLPTKYELNLLYENKEKIGGLHIIHRSDRDIYGWYWSSTEGKWDIYDRNEKRLFPVAWEQSLEDGEQAKVNKVVDNYYRSIPVRFAR
jgi:hypothetical protein